MRVSQFDLLRDLASDYWNEENYLLQLQFFQQLSTSSKDVVASSSAATNVTSSSAPTLTVLKDRRAELGDENRPCVYHRWSHSLSWEIVAVPAANSSASAGTSGSRANKREISSLATGPTADVARASAARLLLKQVEFGALLPDDGVERGYKKELFAVSAFLRKYKRLVDEWREEGGSCGGREAKHELVEELLGIFAGLRQQLLEEDSQTVTARDESRDPKENIQDESTKTKPPPEGKAGSAQQASHAKSGKAGGGFRIGAVSVGAKRRRVVLPATTGSTGTPTATCSKALAVVATKNVGKTPTSMQLRLGRFLWAFIPLQRVWETTLRHGTRDQVQRLLQLVLGTKLTKWYPLPLSTWEFLVETTICYAAENQNKPVREKDSLAIRVLYRLGTPGSGNTSGEEQESHSLVDERDFLDAESRYYFSHFRTSLAIERAVALQNKIAATTAATSEVFELEVVKLTGSTGEDGTSTVKPEVAAWLGNTRSEGVLVVVRWTGAGAEFVAPPPTDGGPPASAAPKPEHEEPAPTTTATNNSRAWRDPPTLPRVVSPAQSSPGTLGFGGPGESPKNPKDAALHTSYQLPTTASFTDVHENDLLILQLNYSAPFLIGRVIGRRDFARRELLVQLETASAKFLLGRSETERRNAARNVGGKHVFAAAKLESVSYDRQVDALRNFSCVKNAFTGTVRGILVDKPGEELKTAGARFVRQVQEQQKQRRLSGTRVQLTAPQQAALDSALGCQLTLIHGPPGTGKTHTCCRILKAWLSGGEQKVGEHLPKLNKTTTSINSQQKRMILAVADTNIAADNLYEGLKKLHCEAHVARIGVNADEDVVDQQLAQHPSYGHLVDLKKMKNTPANAKTIFHLQQQMRRDILNQAAIVISTTVGVGNALYSEFVFDRVLVDECGQATEPSTLVALGRGCEKLVLAGDYKQLPATVLSRSVAKSLGLSLFERLVGNLQYEPILLEHQFRMGADLLEFANKFVYGGKLKEGGAYGGWEGGEGCGGERRKVVPGTEKWWVAEGTGVAGGQEAPLGEGIKLFSSQKAEGTEQEGEREAGRRRVVEERNPPDRDEEKISGTCRPFRIRFVNVGDGREESRGSSKCNEREAVAVLHTLFALFDANTSAGSSSSSDGWSSPSVAILTPYAAQRSLLQALLPRIAKDFLRGASSRRQVDALYPSASTRALSTWTRDVDAEQAFIHRVQKLTPIESVDGFQGREADLVLFSAVRSRCSRSGGERTTNSIGFLADARRMNVMLTRAKRGLVVFGNKASLLPGVGTARTGGDGEDPVLESSWGLWPRWVEYVEGKHAVVDVEKWEKEVLGITRKDGGATASCSAAAAGKSNAAYGAPYGSGGKGSHEYHRKQFSEQSGASAARAQEHKGKKSGWLNSAGDPIKAAWTSSQSNHQKFAITNELRTAMVTNLKRGARPEASNAI